MKPYLIKPLLLSAVVLARPHLVTSGEDLRPENINHANHIFNAIHSSMRQFGSSLYHNGMSVFIAEVPEDTELYHGTSTPHRVNGTEWLAFEPEHALMFARPFRGGPPDGRRGPAKYDEGKFPSPREAEKDDNEESLPHLVHEGAYYNQNFRQGIGYASGKDTLDIIPKQRPIISNDEHGESSQGYLHTYRTKHALRLLYLDGESAAKSNKGTLDLQDLVLLHHEPPAVSHIYATPSTFGKHHKGIGRSSDWRLRTSSQMNEWNHRNDEHARDRKEESTNTAEGEKAAVDFTHYPDRKLGNHITVDNDNQERPPHGPLNEAERAVRLCHIAREEWNGRIDGILRMEGGFEIILCDFEEHLDTICVSQAKDNGGHGPGRNNDEAINSLKAIAARYDGIGGERVTLDYDNFVSLFAYENAIYFDETGRPRVKNETALVEPVRNAIKKMILRENGGDIKKHNWQSTVDMIVTRYSDRIAYLASDDLTDLPSFRAEVYRALRPFINYESRNATSEIARCVSQFLPSSASHSDALAAKAIFNVLATLCHTLSTASEADTLAHGVSVVRALKSWLGWTDWKKCRGCGVHEVCFLPIWPMGSSEDFEQPQCRSDLSRTHGGYWEGFGKP